MKFCNIPETNLVVELLHHVGGDVLDLSLGLLDVGLHAGGAVHHEDDVGSVILLQHPL